MNTGNFVPLDFESLDRALAANDPATETFLALVRSDLNSSGLVRRLKRWSTR